jgi:hypothetical protein
LAWPQGGPSQCQLPSIPIWLKAPVSSSSQSPFPTLISHKKSLPAEMISIRTIGSWAERSSRNHLQQGSQTESTLGHS